jgi:hypothetical protein
MDCQLCSDRGARYRGHLSDYGMTPDDVDSGVPLPDGRVVTFLCDACDDEIAAYWLAVEHGEPAPPLFGEVW